jgi:hypothetical protein
MSLNERCDLSVLPTAQQISLPVSWYRSIQSFCRALANGDCITDLAATLAWRLRAAHLAARAKVAQKLLFKGSASLDEQRPIDRLVRHPHSLVGRIAPLKPSADLLRRPVPCQLARYRALQTLIPCEPASLWSARPIPRLPVRITRSISLDPLVAPHLATHRRCSSTQLPGNPSDRHATSQTARNLFTLVHLQHPR